MTTTSFRPLQVFLCHASEDKAAVRQLHKRLRSNGIKPWLDEEDLLPGQEWQEEIPKAIQASDIVIVCLSQKSTTKAGYVQKEIQYALDIADQQPEGSIFIIPLKLENCAVPTRLQRWQRVNYYENQGYERLIRALQTRAVALDINVSLLPSPATWSRIEWQAGDRVLANWSQDEYWYPATVRSTDGNLIYIRFDDGDKEWTTRSNLMPIDIEVGDAIVCKYKGGPYYYPAHVLQMDGEKIFIRYDRDGEMSKGEPAPGEEEWITISMIRILRYFGTWSHLEWQVGDRVLANPSQDEYWYPATIRATEVDRIYVRFDDIGDKEWVTRNRVMPMDIEVGDAIFCRYKNGNLYYPAHVLQMDQERVYLEYDYDFDDIYEDTTGTDEPKLGDKEWTTTSAIRVFR